ncbi:MAG TPA: TonB-dependent receptor [Thermoanaerobaculia bacterium]|nr:TonB-dependent receptor [Thermoanaerobaculia bacterium]
MAIVLIVPTLAFAQSGSASLSGRVVDQQGAAVPGVTVTATNTATGLVRTTVTAADGSYRFPSLPVGTYNVAAELSGFATVTTEGVVLNVATERELEVTLKQASVTEAITVTADAPLVATEPAIGTVVSQNELENLPLNGRQFANLASLAPGTTLSVNADPTKPGQLTVALNGGSGRNVNYLIDGGDNTDDTIGGALQNFNLEAVQEFKIQTMQYKAEFGRSSGGVLSVVTKTGTNDLSGSVYGFFRDKSLNEKTETEEQAGADKGAYERKQYGGSLGGPIIRDKAHFFGTYEKLDRTTTTTFDTGGIFPSLDGTSQGVPFQDELGTAKLSLNATAKQFLQVRYGYQKNSDKYAAFSYVAPTGWGTISNDYKSVLANHSWTIGGDKLNEFVYQWTRFNNAITADSNDPNFYFPSGVQSGQNVNTPQTTVQEKSQFKDDFSWSSNLGGRRHDFKIGANYIHEPILGGDFTTGTTGRYDMLEDSPNSPVRAITINGGFFGDQTPVDQYSFYGQDDLHFSDQLTLNLGLRYDKWTGFDLDQRTNPLLPLYKAAAAAHPDIPWLKSFANGDADQLEDDDDNFAPRLGFSYDLKGNGKHIVRGGYGIYYDFPYTNATSLFPAAAVQSTFGTVYVNENPTGIRNADGSFFRPGQPLPPNQGGEAAVPNNIAQKSWETPQSTQLSLGYSWEVNNSLGLNFEAVNIKYENIPFRFRANPNIGGTRILGAGTSGNIRVWTGDGEAEYKGFNVGFHARSTMFEAQGFYTWSEAEGNVLTGADEFRLWDGGTQPDAEANTLVNPLDYNDGANFGPLFTDARHRVTISTLYHAPLGINLSGILRYRSATPFSSFAVGNPTNNFGYKNKLVNASHVNTERGDDFSQLDIRVSKEFRFGTNMGIELIGEIFNLLNSKNGTRFVQTSPGVWEPTVFAGDTGQGEQRLAQLGARFRF